MTTLTDKFDELETLLAGQATTLGAYIDTVETKMQAVLDLLDIMNENNAANTKYLIAALGQSGTCFPCPSPPMIVPPIGTTPGTINTDRCKRSQAIIAVIHALLENMDTMQSFNVIGTYNVVYGAISDYIGAIAAGDTVPLPSVPEAVNIAGDYVSYAGERVFSGVGLVEQFAPLESSLISAIYNTTTPGDAQSAYNGVIDASSVSNGASLLFKAIAYVALWSYYFDPDSLPDLSAYDGLVCGAGECVEVMTEAVTISGSGSHAVVWPEGFTSTNNDGAGTTSDHNIWCTDDLFNWTISTDKGVRIFYGGGAHDDIPAGDGRTLPHTTFFAVVFTDTTPEATLELCPPA